VRDGAAMGVKFLAGAQQHRVMTTLGVGELDPIAYRERPGARHSY
jgi:hypothetical protein